MGLDPNPFMEPVAKKACVEAGVGDKLKFVDGLAESMPISDACMDTVICTLTLCSVSNPGKALQVRKQFTGGYLCSVRVHCKGE